MGGGGGGGIEHLFPTNESCHATVKCGTKAFLDTLWSYLYVTTLLLGGCTCLKHNSDLKEEGKALERGYLAGPCVIF